MASSSSSPQMHRSISMPVQPQPLPTKTMQRSQEKETLYEEDYYPESPNCERRHKSRILADERLGCHSQSDNILTTDWAGSTIELNTDLRRNEIDTFYNPPKPYRVIEKNGRENVIFKRLPEKSWRYIRDFVTTLVRMLIPKRFLTNPSTASESCSSFIDCNNATNTTTNATVNKHQESTRDRESQETESDNEATISTARNKLLDSEERSADRVSRKVKFSLYD